MFWSKHIYSRFICLWSVYSRYVFFIYVKTKSKYCFHHLQVHWDIPTRRCSPNTPGSSSQSPAWKETQEPSEAELLALPGMPRLPWSVAGALPPSTPEPPPPNTLNWNDPSLQSQEGLGGHHPPGHITLHPSYLRARGPTEPGQRWCSGSQVTGGSKVAHMYAPGSLGGRVWPGTLCPQNPCQHRIL